jgi:protein TorT
MRSPTVRGVTVTTVAALTLVACGNAADGGGAGSDRESSFDTSQPIPGSDEGTRDAGPDELRAALEADPWWYPASFIDCQAPDTEPEGCVGEIEEGIYNAIPGDMATQEWQICAAMPHVKDPYWVAFDYGLVTEAERFGAELVAYEAGGYTNLAEQMNQIDDCVAGGADAVIIGAISYDGMNAKVDQLKDQGILVLDAVTGIANPRVDGRAVLSWREMGAALGGYLAERGRPDVVGHFPGAAGSGWAEDAAAGLEESVAGTGIEMLSRSYGDIDKNVQLSLVEDALQANPEITVIAGTALTAEVAGDLELGSDITILANYLIPSTLEMIESGKVTCAVSDHPVLQARMTFDMAVRMLEGIPLDDDSQRAFPAPALVCGPGAGDADNVDQFLSETTFAPEGWAPRFHVTP